MQRLFRFSSILLFAFIIPLLSGCGGDTSSSSGSSASGDSSGSGGSGGSSGSSSAAAGVSYFPLAIYEAYPEFSGTTAAGKFQGEGSLNYPFIKHHFINPVDAATLASISTAVVSDYTVTVDDIEIDENESYPLLQKVEGNTVTLQTALVFDLSDSVRSAGVDMAALIAEVKAYIAAARASSDQTIATQEFIVWAFAQNTAAMIPAFTNVDANVATALDDVVTNFNATTLGTSSNLNRAIVEAIGRYVEGVTYDFSADGIDDMIDWATGAYGINLTQMVVFSSGSDTVLEFDAATMTKAIESQQMLKYVASSDIPVYLNKSVIYNVVGGASAGETYGTLSDLAEVTTNVTMTGGVYDFANTLVQAQIAAIDARVDRDNQYLYRYAFLPRIGAHTMVFKSSNATGHNFSLTSETDTTFDASTIGSPYSEFLATNIPSVVEITGPNGEYLSGGVASFANIQTFAPAVRWVNATPAYSWGITNGTGTTNADGTFTVTSVTVSPATLTLTTASYGTYDILVTN